ncbi:multidrug resistance protein [Streptomyces chartreusis NRRL 3882]|uniref:Multidrug resistance protein n=1 Tax=Streptomyces chartreusis NRRL 3882 TaxID=1079985 RepID=A0A2N9B233_STRCX|nr:multidrug resistance protein [Streptomyces chartreusis NRRL 3882]
MPWRRGAPGEPGGVERYRRLLTVPGLRTTLVLGLLVKLPVIAIPMVLSLQVSLGLGRSLSSAGVVTGAWMLGVMAGAPLVGWAVDRAGLRPVLVLSAAAQAVFWAVAAGLSHPALVAGALVSGVLLVPGSTVTRFVISADVPPEHQQAGFALDAVTSQLSYLAGPALGAVLATQTSTTTAAWGLGCVLVLGLATFAVRARAGEAVPDTADGGPGTRASAPGTAPATGKTELVARLLPMLICGFAAGLVSSGFELSLLGVMREQGEVHWVGLLITACGVYAVAGGVLYGALPATLSPVAPVLLLGLATVPLGLVPDWRFLLAAVLPAAMLSAASFAATATACGRLATAHTRGRTVGLYGAVVAGGNAAGAPLAGLTGAAGGPATGFLAVGSTAIVLALLAWLLRFTRVSSLRPLVSQEG